MRDKWFGDYRLGLFRVWCAACNGGGTYGRTSGFGGEEDELVVERVARESFPGMQVEDI